MDFAYVYGVYLAGEANLTYVAVGPFETPHAFDPVITHDGKAYRFMDSYQATTESQQEAILRFFEERNIGLLEPSN